MSAGPNREQPAAADQCAATPDRQAHAVLPGRGDGGRARARSSWSCSTCSQGARLLDGNFFTTDPNPSQCFPHVPGAPPPPPCNIGGIRSALLGTLEIVALATLIAVPVGIVVALWLTEYGKESWYANIVRYFVDVMTGVPSIVFGLFVFTVLVVTHVGGDAVGWKGAVALALLMLPIVVRSAEVVLQLVPAACARPRSRSARRGGAW